jgi:osmotically-inducible protein OsmY
MMKRSPRAGVLALLLAAALLPGCAPLLVGGAAVSGVLVATDRRTSGAQLEDQAIELKAVSLVGAVAGGGNVSVTSHNRTALVTGQVPGEAERAAVEKVVAQIENVRAVVNELAVAPNSSLAQRSSDAIVTAKVKASFLDAKDLQSNAFNVTTEAGVVHLMGIVTEREATRATELARAVDGVRKVVRVFELVSEDALAKLVPQPAPPPAPR